MLVAALGGVGAPLALSSFLPRCCTGLEEGKRTEVKGEMEREREGERKAESWLVAKPVERHALGKEKQTKRGWARRLENHRCDSSQVPIGRPTDQPL